MLDNSMGLQNEKELISKSTRTLTISGFNLQLSLNPYKPQLFCLQNGGNYYTYFKELLCALEGLERGVNHCCCYSYLQRKGIASSSAHQTGMGGRKIVPAWEIPYRRRSNILSLRTNAAFTSRPGPLLHRGMRRVRMWIFVYLLIK